MEEKKEKKRAGLTLYQLWLFCGETEKERERERMCLILTLDGHQFTHTKKRGGGKEGGVKLKGMKLHVTLVPARADRKFKSKGPNSGEQQ